ncbi:hypothetical protein [Bacillus cereus]|nr:hypothetical protein [Bacillus cereus]
MPHILPPYISFVSVLQGLYTTVDRKVFSVAVPHVFVSPNTMGATV